MPQETVASTEGRAASREALVAVPVWDVPVRFVHWAIVALVVGLIVTGKLGGDWLAWHFRFGETLLALVAFRVAWGFAGSRNARFAAFVTGPSRVRRYARSIARRGPELHVTHNPLGGWMVLLLIVALLTQATTGLFSNDDVLWEGPLAARVAKETSDALSWFHRRFWWMVATLSIVHIVAALAYLVVWKDNLIVPMLSGRKRLPAGAADPAHASSSPLRAALLLAACAFAVWYVLHRIAPMPQ